MSETDPDYGSRSQIINASSFLVFQVYVYVYVFVDFILLFNIDPKMFLH